MEALHFTSLEICKKEPDRSYFRQYFSKIGSNLGSYSNLSLSCLWDKNPKAVVLLKPFDENEVLIKEKCLHLTTSQNCLMSNADHDPYGTVSKLFRLYVDSLLSVSDVNDCFPVFGTLNSLAVKSGRAGFMLESVWWMMFCKSSIVRPLHDSSNGFGGFNLVVHKGLLNDMNSFITLYSMPTSNIKTPLEFPCAVECRTEVNKNQEFLCLSFGKADHGKLGHGDVNINRHIPTVIECLRDVPLVKVASISTYVVAVDKAGICYVWGTGGNAGNSADYVSSNSNGSYRADIQPQILEALPEKAVIKDIACGLGHALFLTNSGKVLAWGNGGNGRLGLNDLFDRSEAVPITGLNAENIVKIQCGASHSLAVTDTGKLYSWGKNSQGQCGLGSSSDQLTPCLVSALCDNNVVVKSVGAGWEHSIILSTTGFLYSCGCGYKDNRRGIVPPVLGLGHNEGRSVPELLSSLIISGDGDKVTANLKNIIISSISCGWDHSLALDVNGLVYSWGSGQNGKLGHGSEENYAIPCVISSLEKQKISMISAGCEHSCAVSCDGVVYTWGHGDGGRLGHGDNAPRLIPTVVKTFSIMNVTPVDIHCGDKFTITIVKDVDKSTRDDKLSLKEDSSKVEPIFSWHNFNKQTSMLLEIATSVCDGSMSKASVVSECLLVSDSIPFQNNTNISAKENDLVKVNLFPALDEFSERKSIGSSECAYSINYMHLSLAYLALMCKATKCQKARPDIDKLVELADQMDDTQINMLSILDFRNIILALGNKEYCVESLSHDLFHCLLGVLNESCERFYAKCDIIKNDCGLVPGLNSGNIVVKNGVINSEDIFSTPSRRKDIPDEVSVSVGGTPSMKWGSGVFNSGGTGIKALRERVISDSRDVTEIKELAAASDEVSYDLQLILNEWCWVFATIQILKANMLSIVRISDLLTRRKSEVVESAVVVSVNNKLDIKGENVKETIPPPSQNFSNQRNAVDDDSHNSDDGLDEDELSNASSSLVNSSIQSIQPHEFLDDSNEDIPGVDTYVEKRSVHVPKEFSSMTVEEEVEAIIESLLHTDDEESVEVDSDFSDEVLPADGSLFCERKKLFELLHNPTTVFPRLRDSLEDLVSFCYALVAESNSYCTDISRDFVKKKFQFFGSSRVKMQMSQAVLASFSIWKELITVLGDGFTYFYNSTERRRLILEFLEKPNNVLSLIPVIGYGLDKHVSIRNELLFTTDSVDISMTDGFENSDAHFYCSSLLRLLNFTREHFLSDKLCPFHYPGSRKDDNKYDGDNMNNDARLCLYKMNISISHGLVNLLKVLISERLISNLVPDNFSESSGEHGRDLLDLLNLLVENIVIDITAFVNWAGVVSKLSAYEYDNFSEISAVFQGLFSSQIIPFLCLLFTSKTVLTMPFNAYVLFLNNFVLEVLPFLDKTLISILGFGFEIDDIDAVRPKSYSTFMYELFNNLKTTLLVPVSKILQIFMRGSGNFDIVAFPNMWKDGKFSNEPFDAILDKVVENSLETCENCIYHSHWQNISVDAKHLIWNYFEAKGLQLPLWYYEVNSNERLSDDEFGMLDNIFAVKGKDLVAPAISTIEKQANLIFGVRNSDISTLLLAAISKAPEGVVDEAVTLLMEDFCSLGCLIWNLYAPRVLGSEKLLSVKRSLVKGEDFNSSILDLWFTVKVIVAILTFAKSGLTVNIELGSFEIVLLKWIQEILTSFSEYSEYPLRKIDVLSSSVFNPEEVVDIASRTFQLLNYQNNLVSAKAYGCLLFNNPVSLNISVPNNALICQIVCVSARLLPISEINVLYAHVFVNFLKQILFQFSIKLFANTCRILSVSPVLSDFIRQVFDLVEYKGDDAVQILFSLVSSKPCSVGKDRDGLICAPVYELEILINIADQILSKPFGFEKFDPTASLFSRIALAIRGLLSTVRVKVLDTIEDAKIIALVFRFNSLFNKFCSDLVRRNPIDSFSPCVSGKETYPELICSSFDSLQYIFGNARKFQWDLRSLCYFVRIITEVCNSLIWRSLIMLKRYYSYVKSIYNARIQFQTIRRLRIESCSPIIIPNLTSGLGYFSLGFWFHIPFQTVERIIDKRRKEISLNIGGQNIYKMHVLSRVPETGDFNFLDLCENVVPCVCSPTVSFIFQADNWQTCTVKDVSVAIEVRVNGYMCCDGNHCFEHHQLSSSERVCESNCVKVLSKPITLNRWVNVLISFQKFTCPTTYQKKVGKTLKSISRNPSYVPLLSMGSVQLRVNFELEGSSSGCLITTTPDVQNLVVGGIPTQSKNFDREICLADLFWCNTPLRARKNISISERSNSNKNENLYVSLSFNEIQCLSSDYSKEILDLHPVNYVKVEHSSELSSYSIVPFSYLVSDLESCMSSFNSALLVLKLFLMEAYETVKGKQNFDCYAKECIAVIGCVINIFILGSEEIQDMSLKVLLYIISSLRDFKNFCPPESIALNKELSDLLISTMNILLELTSFALEIKYSSGLSNGNRFNSLVRHSSFRSSMAARYGDFLSTRLSGILSVVDCNSLAEIWVDRVCGSALSIDSTINAFDWGVPTAHNETIILTGMAALFVECEKAKLIDYIFTREFISTFYKSIQHSIQNYVCDEEGFIKFRLNTKYFILRISSGGWPTVLNVNCSVEQSPRSLLLCSDPKFVEHTIFACPATVVKANYLRPGIWLSNCVGNFAKHIVSLKGLSDELFSLLLTPSPLNDSMALSTEMVTGHDNFSYLDPNYLLPHVLKNYVALKNVELVKKLTSSLIESSAVPFLASSLNSNGLRNSSIADSVLNDDFVCKSVHDNMTHLRCLLVILSSLDMKMRSAELNRNELKDYLRQLLPVLQKNLISLLSVAIMSPSTVISSVFEYASKKCVGSSVAEASNKSVVTTNVAAYKTAQLDVLKNLLRDSDMPLMERIIMRFWLKSRNSKKTNFSNANSVCAHDFYRNLDAYYQYFRRKGDVDGLSAEQKCYLINHHIGLATNLCNFLVPLAGEVQVVDNRVRALSHFPSVKTIGVNIEKGTGRWFYEVTVLSDGLMQIGWIDPLFKCDHLCGQGVGDHHHSWAFDGLRLKKWNISCEPYGKRWKTGDVVGVLLDSDLLGKY